MSAKVGPLPVWAWAALILAVGYVIYKRSASSTSSTASTSASSTGSGDVTAPSTDTSTAGPVGPDNSVNPDVGSLNGSLLSQLSGFQSSIDGLTAAVQSSPAFAPGDGYVYTGDSGSGSLITNGAPYPYATATQTPTAAPPPTSQPASHAVTQTTAKPVRYYTFAPGKAPKNRKADEAPAKGPSGTSLHFATGRGYYYA